MKCSVCGNEISSNSTKCSVCGTSIDASSLSRAMSNISSLASALKAKREVSNNTKAFETELKKVATRAQDLEDLYTKDIELKTNEEDYQEDFDLNAFYEQARLEGNDEEDDQVEDSEVVEPYANNEEPEAEEIEEAEEAVEEEFSVSEPEEEEPYENTESNVLEEFEIEEEEEAEDVDSEDSNDDEPIEIELEEDQDTEDDQEVEEVSVYQAQDFGTGYIKESDIVTEEMQDNDNDVVSNSLQSTVESSEQVEEIDFSFGPVENAVSLDNSGYVNLDQPENSGNQTDVVSEEFAPVKAEEVPYTQVEGEGKEGSDDKPIVIDSKDVVTANADTEDISISSSEDTGVKKVKYNKFCARVAKFFLFNSLIVFAVLALHYFVLKDLTETNVVFTFINEFLQQGDNWFYFAIGVLGAGALAILFSLFQFMFVKRRKPGAILFLLSTLVTGLYVGGFYYIEMLMPIIEFVKSMFIK